MIGRVVCIDDDPVSLLLCEKTMQYAAFAQEVIKATNGKEGIAWFSNFFSKTNPDANKNPPQLILLDLQMPVMNGWEFLEDFEMKYADRLPDTKVVIISSSVDPADYARAKRYPIIIDFMNKPISIDGLKELSKNEHLISSFQ